MPDLTRRAGTSDYLSRAGIPGPEGITEDFERAGVFLPAGAAEGIDRVTDLDLDETGLFQQLPPACARQATGNSGGPEIDVADGGFGHRLAVGDVRELQIAARLEHAPDLRKDLPLVGA